LAGESFGRKLTLNDHLRPNPGMVHPRQPESGVTLHAMPADGDIHYSVVEHVPNVK
jgi:hypothetical protein